jgi:hypothetical protein
MRVSESLHLKKDLSFKEAVPQMLNLLKESSQMLRKINSQTVFVDALADVLYLQAHTENYLKANPSY